MFIRTIRTRLSNLKMNSYKQDIDTEDKFSAYANSKFFQNFYVGIEIGLETIKKGINGYQER